MDTPRYVNHVHISWDVMPVKFLMQCGINGWYVEKIISEVPENILEYNPFPIKMTRAPLASRNH